MFYNGQSPSVALDVQRSIHPIGRVGEQTPATKKDIVFITEKRDHTMVNHSIREWMGEATSSSIVEASQFNFEGTISTVTYVLSVLGRISITDDQRYG
ncbi:MAG: hypothetical protein ACPGLY_27555 [Rubripirellula sp.]